MTWASWARSVPRRAVFIAALLGAGIVAFCAVADDTPRRPSFARDSLTITRADGKVVTYAIEVARGETQQAYGLMYIRHLPKDAGMLFPYDPPREVAYWMKNTFIPLDMLFVGRDHRIARIVADNRPHDVMPVRSQLPVMAVLELNGGEAQAQGIAVGDRVDSAALPR